MFKSVLYEAAHAGAAEILRFFQKTFTISNKEGLNNLVTEADLAAEKAILEVIKKHYPKHAILSEEAGELEIISPYRWIIDPIDGTVNFANGIPINGVSIALEKEGKIIMGGVFNPHLNEFFLAEKGLGATLNDKIITVSNCQEAAHACLATGFPYTYTNAPKGPLEVLAQFVEKGVPIRRLGSAAIDLCWVACGRFDAFYEHKLEPWDSAAGSLIVEEAGGKVSHFDGSSYIPRQHNMLASNGHIHEEMLDLINMNKTL